MGAVDEAFESVMPPPAYTNPNPNPNPCDDGGAGKSGRLEEYKVQEEQVAEVWVCVYKILKVELECVRHCDRIWIMVVKYIKIY